MRQDDRSAALGGANPRKDREKGKVTEQFLHKKESSGCTMCDDTLAQMTACVSFLTALERSSLKKRHITIDNVALARLSYPQRGQGLESVGLKHGDLLKDSNLKADAHQLWEEWFRTEAKCFNDMRVYVFSDMIVTGGIVYMREDV